MPREARDAASLWDMLTYVRRVAERVRGKTLEDYLADEDFRLAIERRIEIIGESARRVSAGFQAEHPEIPWRAVMAQRHILAHDYDELIDAKVWDVATIHIPGLIAQLERLVPEES